ncbi:MAG: LolA family protein [Alphaproteobacteria bacterium]
MRRTALVILALAGMAIGPSGSFGASPSDPVELDRIERYLNDVKTMESRFVQVASDGSSATGSIYISRPGKLRVVYDPPNPITVVATGVLLVYYDPEVQQVSYLPLESSAASFLIRERIELGGELEVLGLEYGPSVIRLSLAERDDRAAGRITLVFSDKPLMLRKWTVTDAQGQVTDVALVNPRFDVPLDPVLFKFVDPRPDRPNR